MRNGPLDGADAVISALAAAVEARDSYTERHTHRVAEIARHMGAKMDLRPVALAALYRGGIIHDIGKIGVPDSILLKPGPLDRAELEVMRRHPIIGEAIVRPLSSCAGLLAIIRNHHEHFDGSGYPDRLAGKAICELARIVAVCDAYDALVSDRPYRSAKSAREARRILEHGAGHQWDPVVVGLLIDEMPKLRALGVA